MMFYINEDRTMNRTMLHRGSCAQARNRLQCEPTGVWHGPYETAIEGLDAAIKLGKGTNNVCPTCQP